MLQVAAAYWLGRPELAMEQVQLQFVVPALAWTWLCPIVLWRLHPSKIFPSILLATVIAFLISKIVCGFLTVLGVALPDNCQKPGETVEKVRSDFICGD